MLPWMLAAAATSCSVEVRVLSASGIPGRSPYIDKAKRSCYNNKVHSFFYVRSKMKFKSFLAILMIMALVQHAPTVWNWRGRLSFPDQIRVAGICLVITVFLTGARLIYRFIQTGQPVRR